MPAFPSLAHVAVTVTDLDRSTRWYSALFGSDPVLDEDESPGGFHHTVYLLGGGQLFGLHTHPSPASDRFDEHRTGLDHVAFSARDRHELEVWAARLDDLDIEHGEIKDAVTDRGSRSAILTASPSSSSPRPPRADGSRKVRETPCLHWSSC